MAGDLSGTATLDPSSDCGAGLQSQSIAASGDEFREAAASLTPASLALHVGDTATALLDITNMASANGFSENRLVRVLNAGNGVGQDSVAP